MRRLILVGASVLSLALASEAAAGANTFIGPGKVDKGDSVTVSAKNCQDGPGYKAFVDVEVVKGGKVIDSKSVPADADGTTVVKVKMRRLRRNLVRVRCRHVFDAGGEGIFYEESRVIRVTRG